MAASNLPQWLAKALSGAFADAAKKLHNNELKANTHAGLLSAVGKAISAVVAKAVGQDFATVDYGTPDAEMLARLVRNVWHFSAAKNYQQLQDMTAALLDDEGKVRGWADYREAAKAVNDKFNGTWLRTEYDSAINAATGAARWNDYQKQAGTPYLQYSTAGDKHVRKDHDALDGVVRKMDDSFWQTHYPPNGWKCRCHAQQLSGTTATQTKDIPDVDIPELFRTNLAATGLVFPKGHAYFDGVPRKVLTDALVYLPTDAVYNTVEQWDTGHALSAHVLHGTAELAGNVMVAKLLAEHFGHKKDIRLMPEIGGEMPHDARKKVFGNDVYKGKCPDAKIGGKLWDFKEIRNKYDDGESFGKKLRIDLRRKGEQADNIVIWVEHTQDEKVIRSAVKGYRNATSKERKIIIINGDKVLEL